MTYALQETLFTFLVMVYDRVDDGDNCSYENSGLGRPRFYDASHTSSYVNFFLQVTAFHISCRKRFYTQILQNIENSLKEH